jgi:uncharacterized protein DUF4124
MRTALLVLIALVTSGLSGAATAADIWKWVDANGVTHYSDQPVQGATKVEVRAGNVSQSQPASASPTPSSTPSTPAERGAVYRTFEIWRPENDQSVVNTAGEVNVEIRIEPELQAGHALNLYLDGRLLEDFQGSTSYVLTGVPRGTHTLVATINEQSGARVRETASVSFTVRQESIANPPVGPALRPSTKPQPRAGANKVLTSQPSYGALNGSRAAINPATNLPVAPKPAPKPKKP